MSKSLRTLLIFVVIVIVLGLSALAWFAFYPQASQDETQQVQEEAPTETIEVVPETSPTKNTNPFSGTYSNPFK
ncbi:hypothetical protein HZA87_04935 [Candidatus Uhrbacteria bacterium]|nr:hypothetical protein [Candidatus Uhrbacteria bacterium]